MRSSFLGLEVSKRTVQIAQKSLDVAVGNESNIATPGYTRQRIDTNAYYLSAYKNWQTKSSRLSLAAQGVNAFGVAQVRNFYLDKRYREMNCYLSEYERKMPILQEVETTIDLYENVGMDGILARFKDAMSKYATNAPNNLELSTIVRNSAYDIAKMLNTYARDFDKLLEDNVFETNATVDYVNTIIDKIAMYNQSIVKEYKATEYGNIDTGRGVSAYGPLEMLDARNLLLDELSGYANISVDENVDGSVKVAIGDVVMIDGGKYEHIVMQDFDKFNAVVLCASNGQQMNFRAGEIKAYMDLVNGNGPYANHFQSSEYGIPYYRSAVDAFAEAFSDLMNKANGTVGNPAEGIPDNEYRAMFGSALDVYDADGKLIERGAINAATIKISEEWMQDPSMIGLVYNHDSDTWTYAPNLDGNHANELMMALDQTVKYGRALDFEGTPFDYIAFISNRLGQGIQFLNEQYDSSVTTTNNLLDSRDAVSGVSTDEEGINMLVYQKWYNAAARMMTALDECLDRVINGMGRVGL